MPRAWKNCRFSSSATEWFQPRYAFGKKKQFPWIYMHSGGNAQNTRLMMAFSFLLLSSSSSYFIFSLAVSHFVTPFTTLQFVCSSSFSCSRSCTVRSFSFARFQLFYELLHMLCNKQISTIPRIGWPGRETNRHRVRARDSLLLLRLRYHV